jgi:outer membrane immunogenic protein
MITGKVSPSLGGAIMFKKIVAASLAAATMTASAYAADLRAPAPYVPPPPVFSWTGAYIGLNAGGIFSGHNQDVVLATPGGCDTRFVGCVVARPNYSASLATAINALGIQNGNRQGGFIGGGQIGINFQWNPSFVFGAELDAQGVWTSNNNNNNISLVTVPNLAPGFGAFPVTAFGAVNHRLEYIGTARVRAGFLATPAFLIYGTGGAAVGGVRTSGLVNAGFPTDASVAAGLAASNFNGTNSRVGWTAGGGIEWMFLPNWSLKAEALYYDLGRFRTTLPVVTSLSTVPGVAGGLVGSAVTVIDHRERGIIARAGINYHFFSAPAAPVVARY